MTKNNSLHRPFALPHQHPFKTFAIVFACLFALASYHHQLRFYYPQHVKSVVFDVSADFSALQAEALLHGKLAVRPTPSALVSLPNPYDPDTNNSVARCCGYHDLSLFDGKIYVPQGFGTSLLVDIPTRLTGLGYANPPLKTLFALIVGTWSLVHLVFLVRHRINTTPMSLYEIVATFIVALVINPATWLMVPGRSYEAVAASGYAGLSSGALVLYLAATRFALYPRRRALLFSAGMLLISIGMIARPTTIGVGLGIGLGFLVFAIVSNGTIWNRIADSVSIVMPALLLGALWMWFNYARFGQVLETGHRYQLAGFDMRTYPIGSLDFVAGNFRAYLLTPFQFDRQFPYFSLAANTTTSNLAIQGHERLVGLGAAYPILILGPIGMLVSMLRQRRWGYAWTVVALVITSISALLAVSCLFKDSTMRYLPDFTLGLSFATCLFLSTCSIRHSDRMRPRFVTTSSLLVWGISISLGILISPAI